MLIALCLLADPHWTTHALLPFIRILSHLANGSGIALSGPSRRKPQNWGIATLTPRTLPMALPGHLIGNFLASNLAVERFQLFPIDQGGLSGSIFMGSG